MIILYSVWLFAGVLGFPVAVGWFVYRWQKYAKAARDKDKVDEREHLRKAGILVFVFLLVLVGFVIFSATGAAKQLIQ